MFIPSFIPDLSKNDCLCQKDRVTSYTLMGPSICLANDLITDGAVLQKEEHTEE